MRAPSKRAPLPGLAAVLAAVLLTPALHAGAIPITGRLLAPGGAPLAAASVELLPVVDGYRSGKLEIEGRAEPEPVATALSNARGDFRLNAPEIGMWKVAVRVPGYLPMDSQPLPLVEETELSPLELLPSRGLTVRVLDGTGRPAAGARVQADLNRYVQAVMDAGQRGWIPARRIAWTDERGEAVLPWAPGEELRLRAFVPGFAESGEVVTGESGAVLRVTTAGRLEVELIDAQGKPAAGALVSLGQGRWPAGLADEAGRLSVPVVEKQPLLLAIRPPAGAGEVVELSAGELADHHGSPLRISLSPPAFLTGRVLRQPDDRPLAGALVWPRSNPAAAVRADARGGFRVISAYRGSGTVLAAAPGHLQGQAELDIPAGQSGKEDLGDLKLRPAGLLEGRVVDEEGRPVPDATIQADLESSGHELPSEALRAETRTAPDGRFRFQRLLPSEGYHLTVRKTGCATLTRSAQAAPFRSALPVELVLVKGRVLVGKIVDEEGRPVAGARVMLDRYERVTTGGSGEFEILNPPTATHTLAVYRPGFGPLLVPRLEIAEKDLRIDLGTLTLRKAAVLEGRVADPEGKPVAGAKVVASILAAVVMDRFKGSIQENPGNLVTDAEGRFRVREVHPHERFNLYVRRTGYIDEAIQVTRVTAGQPLEIVLKPEATISGRVIDEAGEPVPDATVRWLPEAEASKLDWLGTTATGPDGSFVLDKLAAGPARLVAAAEGRGTAEIDMTLDAGQDRKDVVLRLRNEGPTLEGRVFDSHGRPLAGASVHAMLVMPLSNRGSATTDESGHFRLDGLLLGEVTVFASHPENFRSIQQKVLLQPGRNEIDLSFPPGHPVAGRVVDDQGEPVADSSIRIESTDRRGEDCQSTTAADGSFTTCELPDGGYQIHAWAQEKGGTPWLPVQVSGRPVTDLELQLQRPGRILGRIRGLEPDQLLWLKIGALQAKGSEGREGRIGHDGRYEISGLFSGTWEIRLFDTRIPHPPPGQRPGMLLGTITLEPGATEAQADFEVAGDGSI